MEAIVFGHLVKSSSQAYELLWCSSHVPASINEDYLVLTCHILAFKYSIVISLNDDEMTNPLSQKRVRFLPK